jgi:hypothetical protein
MTLADIVIVLAQMRVMLAVLGSISFNIQITLIALPSLCEDNNQHYPLKERNRPL